MVVWMLIFWVGILVLAFATASWLFPAGPVASQAIARDILDARFARGELTPEQYRQMRQELGSEPRWGRGRFNSLIVVLIVAVLVLVAFAGSFGMLGGWPGPGYPGPPGEGPHWMMPHMWGR